MHDTAQGSFASETAKIAYCKAFLEQRGYGIQSPAPTLCDEDRETVSTAYIRASTGKQELSGSVQWERILLAHETLGDAVPPMARKFEDKAISGSKRLVDRIEGRKLYEYLQKGDHLWITHFDRLGRNDLDSLLCLEAFAERGVVLHVLDFFGHQFDITRPEDKVIVKMFCAFAKYYRDQISKRTKAAMDYIRSKGGYVGGWSPGFGLRLQGRKKNLKIVPDYHDQKMCNICWTLLRIEGWTQKAVKNLFDSRGVQIPLPKANHHAWRWRVDRICKLMRTYPKRLPFPDCPPDTPTEVDDLKIWPAY